MNWFQRLTQRPGAGKDHDATSKHLVDFIRTRKGVEAWLEQPTNFNKVSLLLVAADGETIRREVANRQHAEQLCEGEDIPCYDAGVVPYPQRMRHYGAKKRKDSRGGSW